jgi:hypothetical protein
MNETAPMEMIRGGFLRRRGSRRPSVSSGEAAGLSDNLVDVLVKIEGAVDTLRVAFGN